MSKPNYRSIVRILVAGASLSIGACEENAPQAPEEPLQPIRNPPEPVLPTWDEVKSGHPDGATNPPSPVLEVTADGARCFKDWHPGMVGLPPEVSEVGGRVLGSAAEAKGTEVICPPTRDELLRKHAARQDPP